MKTNIFFAFEKNILLLLAYSCQDLTLISQLTLTKSLLASMLLVSKFLIFENCEASSANILHIDFKPLVNHLFNKKGPKTEPCSTLNFDVRPLRRTRC